MTYIYIYVYTHIRKYLPKYRMHRASKESEKFWQDLLLDSLVRRQAVLRTASPSVPQSPLLRQNLL